MHLGFTMPNTKPLMLLLCAALSGSVFAKTIYSGEFDYREFEPAAKYFADKNDSAVARMCKSGEHASNEDMGQCSHLKYEHAESHLNKLLQAVRSNYARNDESLRTSGEPLASPFFEKAQTSWAMYRDNQCYSETYSMGEAAERYIFFWECMANVTESRTKELEELLKN